MLVINLPHDFSLRPMEKKNAVFPVFREEIRFRAVEAEAFLVSERINRFQDSSFRKSFAFQVTRKTHSGDSKLIGQFALRDLEVGEDSFQISNNIVGFHKVIVTCVTFIFNKDKKPKESHEMKRKVWAKAT